MVARVFGAEIICFLTLLNCIHCDCYDSGLLGCNDTVSCFPRLPNNVVPPCSWVGRAPKNFAH